MGAVEVKQNNPSSNSMGARLTQNAGSGNSSRPIVLLPPGGGRPSTAAISRCGSRVTVPGSIADLPSAACLSSSSSPRFCAVRRMAVIGWSLRPNAALSRSRTYPFRRGGDGRGRRSRPATDISHQSGRICDGGTRQPLARRNGCERRAGALSLGTRRSRSPACAAGVCGSSNSGQRSRSERRHNSGCGAGGYSFGWASPHRIGSEHAISVGEIEAKPH